MFDKAPAPCIHTWHPIDHYQFVLTVLKTFLLMLLLKEAVVAAQLWGVEALSNITYRSAEGEAEEAGRGQLNLDQNKHPSPIKYCAPGSYFHHFIQTSSKSKFIQNNGVPYHPFWAEKIQQQKELVAKWAVSSCDLSHESVTSSSASVTPPKPSLNCWFNQKTWHSYTAAAQRAPPATTSSTRSPTVAFFWHRAQAT